MFNHSPFGHDTIRKHVIVMGTLLNEIYFERTDADGNVIGIIKVPIAYGPREKVIARRLLDPNLDRPFSSILPFMTFKLDAIARREEDQLSKIGRFYERSSGSNKNSASWAYNPVPYNFLFEVNLIVKSVADGWKIVEQILPWFSPDWTVTVKLIDDPSVILDIRTVVDPVEMSDNYAEGSIEDQRYVTWTLHFMMQGYLFGPSMKSKIIKRVETNFQYGENAGEAYTSLVVTPGLTANGEPTQSANNSIPYSDIGWDTDYGYIESITDGHE